jgi:DNA-binding Xre family transcriptional regulator
VSAVERPRTDRFDSGPTRHLSPHTDGGYGRLERPKGSGHDWGSSGGGTKRLSPPTTMRYVNEKEFGLRLAAAISLRGETQKDLEEKTGISRSTIWRYCSGNAGQISLQNVAMLASHLRVSMDWLVFNKGSIGE